MGSAFFNSGMERRDFIRYLGVSGVMLSLNQCAPSESVRPWRMLFLTDFHMRSERKAPEAMALLAEEVNRLAPDFVLGGGDCIHGGFAGDPLVCEERFVLFEEFIEKIEAPAHWMIGNHDFVAAVDKTGNVLGGDPTRRFRQMTGQTQLYHHFRQGGRSFICLQSVEVVGGEKPYRGFVDAEQLEWVRQTLAGIPHDEPIVLCSHIPLRTTFMQSLYGSLSALPPDLVVENAKEVLDLFQEHTVPLVLQGHLHIDERVTWNDTTFIMAGAVCGAWWKGVNRGTEEGFGLLSFPAEGGHAYRYVDYGWDAKA